MITFTAWTRAVALTIHLANPGPVSTPSFDCDQAHAQSEMLICADPDLARLDSDMESLYRRLLVSVDDDDRRLVRNDQRLWIAQREGLSQESLQTRYRARNAYLRQLLDEPLDRRADVADGTGLSTFRSSAYGFEFEHPSSMRLSRILAGASWTEATEAPPGKPVVAVEVYAPNGPFEAPWVEVRVGVAPMKTVTDCAFSDKPGDVSKVEKRVSRGATFWRKDLTTSDAYTSWNAVEYRSFHSGLCYAVDAMTLDDRNPSRDFQLDPARAEQSKPMQARFKAAVEIAESFHFTQAAPSSRP